MKYCWILIGPPGCGKSTFIKSLGDVKVDGLNFTVSGFGGTGSAVLLSSDMVIDALRENTGQTYAEAFETLYSAADTQFNFALNDAIARGDNIVVDRTSMSVKSRRKYFSVLPKDYKVVAIDLIAKMRAVVWAQRAKNREDKVVPKGVMMDMLMNYEAPTLDEGFSSITEI